MHEHGQIPFNQVHRQTQIDTHMHTRARASVLSRPAPSEAADDACAPPPKLKTNTQEQQQGRRRLTAFSGPLTLEAPPVGAASFVVQASVAGVNKCTHARRVNSRARLILLPRPRIRTGAKLKDRCRRLQLQRVCAHHCSIVSGCVCHEHVCWIAARLLQRKVCIHAKAFTRVSRHTHPHSLDSLSEPSAVSWKTVAIPLTP